MLFLLWVLNVSFCLLSSVLFWMVDLVFLLIPLNIAELYCHARAPPLRFLHQLRFLPNKEMEFTGNEASKLHLSGISFLFFFLLYSQFCCLSSCASETGLETGIYKSYGRFCAVCRFQVEELLSAMIFTSLRIMTETLTDITYIQGAVSDQWGKSSCLDSLKHEVILHLRVRFLLLLLFVYFYRACCYFWDLKC